uniref:HNH endonuclease:HNH nuclease n=2 Tax=Prochlorococcus TaxID=1218 RepID=A0A0D5A3Y5_PROMR|nr:HNH endonuclease:HNH nuclease [Prochlorococcus marinus str. P0903-H212]
MAIRAWTEGDIRLALRLLKWAQPKKGKNLEKSKTQLSEDYSWQAA